jgi:hypothetical protein
MKSSELAETRQPRALPSATPFAMMYKRSQGGIASYPEHSEFKRKAWNCGLPSRNSDRIVRPRCFTSDSRYPEWPDSAGCIEGQLFVQPRLMCNLIRESLFWSASLRIQGLPYGVIPSERYDDQTQRAENSI